MASSKALYFVAIIPPNQVKEEVLELKLEMKKKFHASHALKLPAHITILPPFWLEDVMESDLIKNLDAVALAQKSFPVQLKNFGHFGKRVIFINVEDPQLVKVLFKELTKALESCIPEIQASKIHPHITLATKDLSGQNFKKAWQEFKSRPYSNSFKVKALFLLKHNGKSWDIFREFTFGGGFSTEVA